MTLRAFTMPKWGIEMQQGTVAEWLVEEGQAFAKGDLLALIETDKITNEIEAEAPGILAKQVAAKGETRAVGALLAVFGDAGDDAAAAAAFAAKFAAADTRTAAGSAPKPVAVPAAGIPSDLKISPAAKRFAEEQGLDVANLTGSGKGGRLSLQDVEQAAKPAIAPIARPPVDIAPGTEALDRFYASPLAKRLALLHGVDLSGLTGTGPRGRIRKEDVLARVAPPAPPPETPAGDVEILPMSSLRRTIARRLTEAKATIPHFYLRSEIRTDALLELRSTANLVLGLKVSVNDYLIRAVALALMEVRDVNIQVHGDAIHRFASADISIAVAGERGLMTPILRAAERLRIQDIAEQTKVLIGKGQAGRLAMEEIAGGSFTISNLGMYGVDQFDAIINPPQGAILAVGTVRRVWGEAADGTGRFEGRMSVTLSCDHRAIDGATGARFLQVLKGYLEEPKRLI
jgi:pyruvate dehydrogenase E2 component (dihydrolipoamide acetyltransferase)